MLGTRRPVVIEDYTLTGVFRPNLVDAYAGLFARAGLAGASVRSLFETPAAAMESTLEDLDLRHGGAVGYSIDAAGLSELDSDTLRANLLALGGAVQSWCHLDA